MTTIQRFLCTFDSCTQNFSTKYGLDRHHDAMHSDSVYICSEEGCLKKFKGREHLRNHMALHDKTKTVTCCVCNKNVLKIRSDSHMKTHETDRVKSFECDTCSISYYAKHHLNRHKSTAGSCAKYLKRKEKIVQDIAAADEITYDDIPDETADTSIDYKNERWRTIEEFPKYQISDCGRVRHSITHRIRFLKPNPQGYITIILQSGSRTYLRAVHRLVATAFLPNDENKRSVDHINRNKLDNRLQNLRWSTISEQMLNRRRIVAASSRKSILQLDDQKRLCQKHDSLIIAGNYIMKKYRQHAAKSAQAVIRNACRTGAKAFGCYWQYEGYTVIENEEWTCITIDGYVFNVSDHGRVKSKNGRISYGSKDAAGYMTTISWKGGKGGSGKAAKIHRLVAMGFIPNTNENCKYVNHIDGVKHNNHVDNLEWVTHQENMLHAARVLGKRV